MRNVERGGAYVCIRSCLCLIPRIYECPSYCCLDAASSWLPSMFLIAKPQHGSHCCSECKPFILRVNIDPTPCLGVPTYEDVSVLCGVAWRPWETSPASSILHSYPGDSGERASRVQPVVSLSTDEGCLLLPLSPGGVGGVLRSGQAGHSHPQ